MRTYKYCVAQVNRYGGKFEISFYAYENSGYGLHRVDDWDNKNVLWYDTEKEAMKHRLNGSDCVLSRLFE